jgi:hypothetical protein
MNTLPNADADLDEQPTDRGELLQTAEFLLRHLRETSHEDLVDAVAMFVGAVTDYLRAEAPAIVLGPTRFDVEIATLKKLSARFDEAKYDDTTAETARLLGEAASYCRQAAMCLRMLEVGSRNGMV